MKYDKPNRYLKSTWAFMFVMCILLASALMVANCFALDVVDTPTITTPQSCYMESVIETGEEHSAIIHNGEYVPGIGTTTFHTYCNDFNGYAIYAIGYSGDTNGNTKMLHETTSTFDFDTGVATSGADSNWAMMLTAAMGLIAPLFIRILVELIHPTTSFRVNSPRSYHTGRAPIYRLLVELRRGLRLHLLMQYGCHPLKMPEATLEKCAMSWSILQMRLRRLDLRFI